MSTMRFIKCLYFFPAPCLNIWSLSRFWASIQNSKHYHITSFRFTEIQLMLIYCEKKKQLKSNPEVVQIRLFYHCDTVSPTIAAWSVVCTSVSVWIGQQRTDVKKKKKKKHRTVYYCNLMIRYDRQSRDTSSLHLCLVCFFIYWSMITIVKNAATSTVFCQLMPDEGTSASQIGIILVVWLRTIHRSIISLQQEHS